MSENVYRCKEVVSITAITGHSTSFWLVRNFIIEPSKLGAGIDLLPRVGMSLR